MELACDSLRFIEPLWMFSILSKKTSLLSMAAKKKDQTDLVEVQLFAPEVLKEPLRLALGTVLANVIANQ